MMLNHPASIDSFKMHSCALSHIGSPFMVNTCFFCQDESMRLLMLRAEKWKSSSCHLAVSPSQKQMHSCTLFSHE